MNAHTPHILFSGGVTGGHLFPGLAVAESFCALQPDARITFAGPGREREIQLVSRAGFEYAAIPSRPVPHKARDAWQFLADNFAGTCRAARLLVSEHVSLVVGLGGYSSLPAARAANRRGIPLVLLEQNALPGRATRWLARSAALVCLAMAEAADHLKTAAPVLVYGNPVCEELVRLTRHRRRTEPAVACGKRRLVILGGSGGSHEINQLTPFALYKCRDRLRGWEIVHQTGHGALASTRALYRKFGLTASVVPFILNMAQVLRHADVAVSRAGGTTLAELAVAGVPAVLVPLANATDNHQRKNADVFARARAVAIVDRREISGRADTALAKSLAPLLDDESVRREMATAMRAVARPDAANRVAILIRDLLVAARHRAVA